MCCTFLVINSIILNTYKLITSDFLSSKYDPDFDNFGVLPCYNLNLDICRYISLTITFPYPLSNKMHINIC